MFFFASCHFFLRKGYVPYLLIIHQTLNIVRYFLLLGVFTSGKRKNVAKSSLLYVHAISNAIPDKGLRTVCLG